MKVPDFLAQLYFLERGGFRADVYLSLAMLIIFMISTILVICGRGDY